MVEWTVRMELGPKKESKKSQGEWISTVYFRLGTKVITATRPRDSCARSVRVWVCGDVLGQPPGVSYLHHWGVRIVLSYLAGAMDGRTVPGVSEMKCYVCLWWWRWGCYLACNPDEEVHHSVCMLFLDRFGEHGLCTWHGLAAAKHLKTHINIIINMSVFILRKGRVY